MLTQIGYIPNVEQSASALEGLRQLIFIYPSMLAMVAAIMMGAFYKLNEQLFMKIIAEINVRKEIQAEQAVDPLPVKTEAIKQM